MINAPNISLSGDFARIISRTIQGFDTGGKAGPISIYAADSIVLEDRARVDSSTFTNGSAGEVYLQTGSLSLLNAGAINSFTTNAGQSGKILIDASQNIKISGTIPLFESQRPSEIRVTAGGSITSSASSGDAGSLNISTPRLEIEKGGQLQLDSALDANVGEIVLNVEEIALQEGGQIVLDANNEGSVGSLTITGLDGDDLAKSILISGQGELGIDGNPSGIYATSRALGHSRGANITLMTEELKILDFGQVAFGILDGDSDRAVPGNLTIGAHRVRLHNSQLGAPFFIEFSDQKNLSSGQIILNVETLELDNSRISASTFLDNVQGGTITLSGLAQERAHTLRLWNSSQILAETLSGADGGTISLSAEQILLGQGSRVSVSNQPQEVPNQLGNPGNINITNSSRLFIGSASSLSADNNQINQSSPSVGNIKISLDQLLLFEWWAYFYKCAYLIDWRE
ncbi:MAG: hypothetical protein HC810_00305, partial [Acaryochloridaceae cyanobacterium RL_2_7]|nr:hypothetical protein [Acaryochloridaceae cyanobacterium RL_2_7]